jgi:hypothetical protein
MTLRKVINRGWRRAMYGDNHEKDREGDYIAMMKETMEHWYSKPRNGWHVTDIALCPRQRVFKVIDPLPLTDKELNMYSSGKAIHEAVQWLFTSDPKRYEKEKYVEYNDIEGSIDIFDKKRSHPLNLKH